MQGENSVINASRRFKLNYVIVSSTEIRNAGDYIDNVVTITKTREQTAIDVGSRYNE
jgi:hypothetical protein